jgi:amino acid transporter
MVKILAALPATASLGGGGASIAVGWPLGCLVSGIFAVAVAQIASAYPAAGGVYP